MRAFLSFFRTPSKGRKELVKEFCEIKKEIRSQVNAYMKSQQALVALVYSGTRQQINEQQAHIETERQELSSLLKKREQVRCLLAQLRNGTA